MVTLNCELVENTGKVQVKHCQLQREGQHHVVSEGKEWSAADDKLLARVVLSGRVT